MNKPELQMFQAQLEERIKQGADYVHPATLLKLISILLKEDNPL